jgi:hypothetical protein
MARRRKVAGLDLLTDLPRKLEVLERELAVQRAALDRLKEIGTPRRGLPAEKADRSDVTSDRF